MFKKILINTKKILKEDKKKFFFIVALLIFTFLRIQQINRYDLWFDELSTSIYTFHSITKFSIISHVPPLELFLKKISYDPHSFLYSVSIFIYSFFFRGELFLRLFSVIFSILSLIVFYKLAKLLYGKKTAFYALLLLGIHPFHIWYAQEARCYSLACFLSILTAYNFFKYLKKDTNKNLFYFSLSSVLLFLTLYISIFYILTAFLLLLFNKHKISRIICMITLAAFPAIYYFQTIASKQLIFVKKSFWLTKPSLSSLWGTIQAFSFGYSGYTTQYNFLIYLYIGLFLLGIYYTFRIDRTKSISLLTFLGVPIISAYIISVFIMPIYLNRQLFIFFPFYILFIAVGISTIKKQNIRILLFVIVMFSSLISIKNSDKGSIPKNNTQKEIMGGLFTEFNYKNVISILNKRYADGDVVLSSELLSHLIALTQFINSDSFDENRIPLFAFVPRHLSNFRKSSLEISHEIWRKKIGGSSDIYVYNSILRDGIKNFSFIKDKYKRFWLIRCKWDKYKPFGISVNVDVVHKYLSKNFRLVYSIKTDYISLELYKSK